MDKCPYFFTFSAEFREFDITACPGVGSRAHWRGESGDLRSFPRHLGPYRGMNCGSGVVFGLHMSLLESIDKFWFLCRSVAFWEVAAPVEQMRKEN